MRQQLEVLESVLARQEALHSKPTPEQKPEQRSEQRPEQRPEPKSQPKLAKSSPAPAPSKRKTKTPTRSTRKKIRKTKSKKRSPLAVRPPSIASRLPEPTTDLERHSRKCLVCKHPDREQIDHEFLSWQHPEEIADDFDLPESRYIYRHARATGLFDLRRMNVRCALECFIEEANRVQPEAETIVRAIRAYTRINARGEWNEPPSHVIYSTHHENVHQSVHQDIANQLNVAVQSALPQMPASAPEPLPPPIDIQLLPPAGISPETSAGSSAAQPDSNHGSVIRNHT
jgi:hypothetical protein